MIDAAAEFLRLAPADLLPHLTPDEAHNAAWGALHAGFRSVGMTSRKLEGISRILAGATSLMEGLEDFPVAAGASQAVADTARWAEALRVVESLGGEACP